MPKAIPTASTPAPPRTVHDAGHTLLPLGALMLAASCNTWAQTASPTPAATPAQRSLGTVTVREAAQAPEGKDALRATQTSIGKGNQALRDIPQSITVVTEKLIDDRNLDTVKDVLRQTSGVTFQAAEGGEEDIRVRGFSLATTGDIYLDGLRDPAFYDRDTFNLDRVELIRGSASMLFGRGSTGGAVNQVSKPPRQVQEHEISTTLGSHRYRRVTGDFNLPLGNEAALRINAMATKADNNGAGSSIDKNGLAVAWRAGIGTANEFLVSLYHLKNDNGINYGLPWIRPRSTDTSAANTIIGSLKPTDYFGLSSDRNAGGADILTLAHTHRFSGDSEIKTQFRKGRFERDLRASTVRLAAATAQPGGLAPDLSNFGPSTVFTRGAPLKIQDLDTTQLQSDWSSKFNAWGWKHHLMAGMDFSREEKVVYAARSTAQGGIDLPKPNTTAAQTDGFGSINEGARVLREGNRFTSSALGLYAQDLVEVAPHWKVLAGLRHDTMRGRFASNAIPTNAAGPMTVTHYRQDISEWSQRAGLLYQPDAQRSFHVMYGTSFNTSGDTYSYNAQSANTPPEKSSNFEIGARFETDDKRFTTRLAAFRTTKLNERNTDPDTAATRLLLSGKRHSAGIEVDAIGYLSPKWELFASYTWMPVARVDAAASTATTVGNRVGDRPGLSPRHSGTVWNTWIPNPQWRVGAAVNFRGRQSPADVTAPAWEAPSFATVDLMAEYKISPGWTLRTNLNNVANKTYADMLYRGHYIPGTGRVLTMTLTAKI